MKLFTYATICLTFMSGGIAFGASLYTVPVAQYFSGVQYGPPCCIGYWLATNNAPGSAYGTANANFNGGSYTGQGTAVSTVNWAGPGQLDPTVRADVGDSFTGTYTQGIGPWYGATATITYYLDISSIDPNQTQLPPNVLHLAANGAGSVTGAGAAVATMWIGGTYFIYLDVGNGSGFSPFDGYLTLDTNTIYAVMITATVTAAGYSGDNSAAAYLDPVFTIAPPYQSQYQILLSPDLATVAGAPEPESLLLLGGGLLSAAFGLRRNRNI
jgi:hypothetical protein